MTARGGCHCSGHGLPTHPPGTVQVGAGSLTTSILGGRLAGLRACWLYDPTDPLAVVLRLRSTGGWVDWAMARTLLGQAVTPCVDEPAARALARAGTRQATGEGDVRLELLRDPDGHQEQDRIWIELHPPYDPPVILIGQAEDARALLRLADRAAPDLDADWLVSTELEALLAELSEPSQ